MSDVAFRPYRPGEAARLADIYRRSVAEVGARHYSAEQIAAWLTLAPTAADLDGRMADGRTRIVAARPDDDQPLAFADLGPDGHIDLFYAAPEAAGSGTAYGLYRALEDEAVARGISRLFTEASEAARGFFTRNGFVLVERRALMVAGTAIHNYAMEKRLLPE